HEPHRDVADAGHPPAGRKRGSRGGRGHGSAHPYLYFRPKPLASLGIGLSPSMASSLRSSAILVLHTVRAARVVPLDGPGRAHDITGAALDAVLVLELHDALVEREASGGAAVHAHEVRARLADALVDGDVGVLVRVEVVARRAEHRLDFHGLLGQLRHASSPQRDFLALSANLPSFTRLTFCSLSCRRTRVSVVSLGSPV